MRIAAFITWCFERPKAIFFLSVLLLMGGWAAWRNLPVEAYPDLGPVTVIITTQMPGLAAEEMEQQVTIPLERALASVPNVTESRSSSTFGLSLITLIFRDGTNVFLARQQVLAQLATVPLSNGAEPELGPISGPSGEIYRYTLESDQENLMALSDAQRWIVIPALQRVPGIVDVANFGGFTKEYQLVLAPNSLVRYGVSLQDVINALKNSNTDAGGGRVSRGEQSYIIRGIGLLHSLDDMGKVVVTQHNGVPVLIRDLGRVEFGHQIRQGLVGKDRNPDTVEGVVTMLRDANPSQVLNDLHATVEKLQHRLAPMHMRIVPYLDRDNLVHATIEKVGETITEGVLLVLVILTFFLGSPRCAVITALTIPFALAVAFLLMQAFSMPANLFSLGAIDFGVIVDGAIVVAESLLRLREDEPGQLLNKSLALEVTCRAGRAIFTSTMIIIVAYSPLFAFQNIEGKLMHPMAFTVSFALLGALLCALALTPTLTYLALRKPGKIWHNKFLDWVQKAYRHTLDHFLNRPLPIYLGAAGALVAVVFLGARTGREFMPDLDEGALWLQVQMPTAIALNDAAELANKLRTVVRSFPETSYAVTQLGRSDDGTDPWTPSHVEMPVGLIPYSQWPRGETKEMMVERLHTALAEKVPGITFDITQPIQDSIDDMMAGAHSPLVLRVYGDDFQELRRLGQKIVDVLWKVPGTTQADIYQEPRIPQIQITADRLRAARYGVSVNDIADVVTYAIGDGPITSVMDGPRIYNATLHVGQPTLDNLQALGQLPIMTSAKTAIPLSEVADIRLHMGESNIAHQLGERQITIQVSSGNRPMSQYLDDARARIAKEVKYDPEAYHLEWAGTFQQEQRAQDRLIKALGVVFLVMIGLLYMEFHQIRMALLILGTVPLATLGGLIALHLRHDTLNIATAVGFIALFGVAIQNGIIMLSSIGRHRLSGRAIHEATLNGAVERLRPVLTTATVATAGMLPAALATGIGTNVQRGLATVVVGGLGIATLLTLFILPVLYCRMEESVARRILRKEEKMKARQAQAGGESA
ncbi:efflux RND transporter permease subunit [Oecophyllibacter saccharovorans]|uniref:efflux RND transporter permease subunit n=1 Tax=Oecophyllibacter saccharovorans TaxID=2558360 RepID=UPI001169E9BC|nr:CusA/CzcA family heavy metal efflux RND transporter [Oecophyllibacter saccharovorans]TPW33674.1 efflux RND transporter permease subunit [Oecophyllibacter saccharovorans]